MSYAFALGVTCPEGWSIDASGSCHSPTATECPPGFTQRVPGECWPASESACWTTLQQYFNPEQPDRCRKECPEGTKADANHVCRRVPEVLTPTVIGMIVLGSVAAIALAARR